MPTTAPTPAPRPSSTPTTPAPPTTTPARSPTPAPSATPTATASGDEEVEFTGVVDVIGTTSWQISGQTVLITAETEIRDNPQVGDVVEVRAVRDGQGVLTATRIRLEDSSGPSGSTATPASGGPTPTPIVSTPEPTPSVEASETDEPEEVEFEGTVTAINGNVWTIGGQSVIVTGETELEDNPQVGSYVEVRAWQNLDGTLVARRIRVR
jgi:hypothetical protein